MSPQANSELTSLLTTEETHFLYEQALKRVSSELGRHCAIIIDGQPVVASEERGMGKEFETRSPIDTSIVLGFFQRATISHAKRAIQSAKSAFKTWRVVPWQDRVKIIRRLGDLIQESLFDLSALLTYEIGKNRYEAIGEISAAIDEVRGYADLMDENGGYILPPTRQPVPGEKIVNLLKPYGAWFAITPFNFPVQNSAGTLAAALITGNTVNFKPSSKAPLSGMRIYEIFVKAGVQPGALNFITGSGKMISSEVTRNPDVDGIAFAGSVEAGTSVYKDFVKYQEYSKPCICRMGGKNPTIVTSNADLKRAALGVTKSAFSFSGQKCGATSRVFVDKNVSAEFLRLLKETLDRIQVGDPRNKSSFMGPVISEDAVSRYQQAIVLCEKQGAKIFVGGTMSENVPKGYYVRPVVVTELNASSKQIDRELLIPFIWIQRSRDLADSLKNANEANFGLSAGIFSDEKDELVEFFNKIESGVTFANRGSGATTGAWPGLQPYLGWKASGTVGKGLGGRYYLLEFMREQSQTTVENDSIDEPS